MTLRFPGAQKATKAELLAHLIERNPDLLDPAIEVVHGHAERDANICLISWRNRSVPADEGDCG